jgi:hypothetical protein
MNGPRPPPHDHAWHLSPAPLEVFSELEISRSPEEYRLFLESWRKIHFEGPLTPDRVRYVQGVRGTAKGFSGNKRNDMIGLAPDSSSSASSSTAGSS